MFRSVLRHVSMFCKTQLIQFISQVHMGHIVGKCTFWLVPTAKSRNNLRGCAVWSESSQGKIQKKTFSNAILCNLFAAATFGMTSQRANDVYTTSAQRRCNVMTLHRRWGDVVLTSCVRCDSTSCYKDVVVAEMLTHLCLASHWQTV